MTEISLQRDKVAVEGKYGPWTAHNFHLRDQVFTITDGIAGDEIKLRRVLQVVSDLVPGPMTQLRILDLACLEGMYAIEFARQGASVCAIEGREANLEKARFAARALSLGNVEFIADDVRNFSHHTYGHFDVVLCLGILYHLDTPDVFRFLEAIFAATTRCVVVDTHISLEPAKQHVHNGATYWGKTVDEHPVDASREQKERNLWASLDNPTSVHFTRPSLCRLLYDIGFTSVYECHIPHEPDKPSQRATFVAIKGTERPPLGCPQLPTGHAREWFEPPLPQRRPSVRSGFRGVSRVVPAAVKRLLREMLFSDNNGPR